MGFDVQQLPDRALFGVLRAGRIARRRTNPLVVFADQLLVAEVFVRRVAPVHLTHALVEVLGEGFRQTVSNRFHHDFVVIIVLRFERIRQRVFFQTAGYRKGTDIIGFATQLRRDEIGQAVVGKAHFLRLLAQMAADRQHVGAGFIAINFHVVAHAVRREQAHHAARVEGFLCAQRVEHVVGIFKQALRLLADHLILQDARIFARQ